MRSRRVRPGVEPDRQLNLQCARLDDPGDLQVLYQTVLNQAVTADELCQWLDEATLRRIWHSLWLPGRLRALWQARFPELGASPTATASCVEPIHLRLAEIGLQVAGRYGFALAGG